MAVTTAREWHDAVVAAFESGFGNRLKQCGAYDPAVGVDGELKTAIETPSVLIDLDYMSPADVPSRDVAVMCNWSAYCVLSTRTTDLQVALREMAIVAVGLVGQQDDDDPTAQKGNRWGLGDAVGYPEEGSIEAAPSEFSPGLNGYDAWVIRWQQVGFFSEALPSGGVSTP